MTIDDPEQLIVDVQTLQTWIEASTITPRLNGRTGGKS